MAPPSSARFWDTTRRYAEDVASTARLFLPAAPGAAERLRRACDDLFALLAGSPAHPAALETALGSVLAVEAEVDRAAEALPPDVHLLLSTRARLLRRRLASLRRTA